MKKTNAMRFLDQAGVLYELIEYDENTPVDGQEIARLNGLPEDQVFKTLVLYSEDGDHFLFLLPVNKDLDLKRAARLAGKKKLKLLPSRDLEDLTGYIRGGCSPLGMKRDFPAWMDLSGREFEKIYISAGKKGLQIGLALEDLEKVRKIKFDRIIKEDI
ncbi:MAG: Cys-tRNA(Pro) deacylase [Tissierellia bacterium]|nr:Cys-tRNA(Pro) deacylase [Tissierellia bacterium]